MTTGKLMLMLPKNCLPGSQPPSSRNRVALSPQQRGRANSRDKQLQTSNRRQQLRLCPLQPRSGATIHIFAVRMVTVSPIKTVLPHRLMSRADGTFYGKRRFLCMDTTPPLYGEIRCSCQVPTMMRELYIAIMWRTENCCGRQRPIISRVPRPRRSM